MTTFADLPRVPLAHLPTRLQACPQLAPLVGGREVWVKRDDETSTLASGNKLRKLEFYLAEAQQQGADTLITSGGPLSNHCRTTAVVAREHGMDVGLLLVGPEDPVVDGNYLLMNLLDAAVRIVPPGHGRPGDEIMEEMAEVFRARGQRPYIVPGGGSAPLGVVAYALAARELVEQLREMSLSVDAVTITVGSGSTHAGLVLGAYLFGLEARVIGMSISAPAQAAEAKARRLIDETIERFSLPVAVPDEGIRVCEGYVGEGYGVPQDEDLAAIADVARRTGIILDPTYTGKALRGTMAEMNDGLLADCRRVVFVHTGGLFGLFPKRQRFAFKLRRV